MNYPINLPCGEIRNNQSQRSQGREAQTLRRFNLNNDPIKNYWIRYSFN